MDHSWTGCLLQAGATYLTRGTQLSEVASGAVYRRPPGFSPLAKELPLGPDEPACRVSNRHSRTADAGDPYGG